MRVIYWENMNGRNSRMNDWLQRTLLRLFVTHHEMGSVRRFGQAITSESVRPTNALSLDRPLETLTKFCMLIVNPAAGDVAVGY